MTLYGWHKDLINRTLVPVGIPDGVSPVPDAVLNMLKCGGSSNSSCSSKRCSCSSSRIVCSIMCKCRGDPDVCHNKETRRAAAAEVENAKEDRMDDNEKDICNAYDSIFVDM